MIGALYASALERAGAVPVLLTPAHGAASLARLTDLIDGLLLPGGEDIDPARYGRPADPALEPPNPTRDELELNVLAQALSRGIPVLAVCRGMQLLNVARGGTLHQDLATSRPGPIEHRQRAPLHETAHRVRIAPNSPLARVLGADGLRVNSFHHQGIERLGEGLVATAWAPDGLVEGVELADRSWVLGVQWHPERSLEGEPSGPNLRLFAGLVQAAGGRRSRSA